MFQKQDQRTFTTKFLTWTALLTTLSASLVYVLTHGMKVIMIADTKVSSWPVVDYFWPVIALSALGTIFFCAMGGLIFYAFFKKRLQTPAAKLQADLKRMASGDFSHTVEFWEAQDIYDVAVDAEKTREALQERLTMVRDRYNAIKNFLDQRDFEVNGQNCEILKQKLKDVDELLKDFKLQDQASKTAPVNRIKDIAQVNLTPQSETVLKDAEEFLKI